MGTKDIVISFEKPGQFVDVLTELARQGAREMLAKAMDLEVDNFLSQHVKEGTETGKRRFVRNGHLPEREIQTGIGNIGIQVPRVRDRVPEKDEIKFSSNIIPPYLRRSKSMETLLPLLYLRGISTGAFKETLTPLLGEEPKNLSPNVIGRLKTVWLDEYEKWAKRDLSQKKYVYIWADGIYLRARMEEAQNCVLVIIGVDEYGKKELIALEDGLRESKLSWHSLLQSLKQRGLIGSPKVGVGDGALGFWAALTEEYPQTKHQRCWVHKTCNVLDKLQNHYTQKQNQICMRFGCQPHKRQQIKLLMFLLIAIKQNIRKQQNAY